MQALGRLKPGKMNKSESAYADHLEALKKAGNLHSYQFEAIKFRLADNTFYSPDFLVISANMFVEIHEFKGFWQDDARVKIKVAAALYPFFRFVAVTKNKSGYHYEDFE